MEGEGGQVGWRYCEMRRGWGVLSGREGLRASVGVPYGRVLGLVGARRSQEKEGLAPWPTAARRRNSSRGALEQRRPASNRPARAGRAVCQQGARRQRGSKSVRSSAGGLRENIGGWSPCVKASLETSVRLRRAILLPSSSALSKPLYRSTCVHEREAQWSTN